MNNTTFWFGLLLRNSLSQKSPSFPVLMSVLKFMSNRITSGWNVFTVLISWAGDGRISTASNRMGNRIFNADRIPALSSTTSTFPTFFIFIGLDYSETDSVTEMFSAPAAFKAAMRAST